MLSTYRLRSKKTILTLIMVAMTCISAGAYEYDYSFDNNAPYQKLSSESAKTIPM